MRDFHAKMMNIRHVAANLQTVEYKMGHRDARHDAAQIASHADAEIRRLEREVAALQGVREAAWRLLREAELDDMEKRAGWDCWMLHLRAALKALAPTEPLEGESADLIGESNE